MDSTSKNYVTYELFIGSLAGFSLVLMACYTLPVHVRVKEVAWIVNNFIAFIFLFDFVRGLWMAPNKAKYLKWGWLTLLGGIPFVPALTLFRAWRVTNLFRYVRDNGEHRFFTALLRVPATSVLLSTFFLAIVVITFSSMVVVAFEIASPDSNIKTGPDALWWAVVTVATVGYGDRFPVTPGGRLIGGALMVVGVGLFGVLSSFLASKFINQQQAGEIELKQEVAGLRAQMAAMQQSMNELTHAVTGAKGEKEEAAGDEGGEVEHATR
jgi:voltage-gated potassium channel